MHLPFHFFYFFGSDLPGPSTVAFVIAVLLALIIIVDGWLNSQIFSLV